MGLSKIAKEIFEGSFPEEEMAQYQEKCRVWIAKKEENGERMDVTVCRILFLMRIHAFLSLGVRVYK